MKLDFSYTKLGYDLDNILELAKGIKKINAKKLKLNLEKSQLFSYIEHF